MAVVAPAGATTGITSATLGDSAIGTNIGTIAKTNKMRKAGIHYRLFAICLYYSLSSFLIPSIILLHWFANPAEQP